MAQIILKLELILGEMNSLDCISLCATLMNKKLHQLLSDNGYLFTETSSHIIVKRKVISSVQYCYLLFWVVLFYLFQRLA